MTGASASEKPVSHQPMLVRLRSHPSCASQLCKCMQTYSSQLGILSIGPDLHLNLRRGGHRHRHHRFADCARIPLKMRADCSSDRYSPTCEPWNRFLRSILTCALPLLSVRSTQASVQTSISWIPNEENCQAMGSKRKSKVCNGLCRTA